MCNALPIQGRKTRMTFQRSKIILLTALLVALHQTAFALIITTSQIADGAVTSSKIAAGAVTDAHITGPISAAKIQDGVFQKKYANVIVVAKNGGDFTNPIAALDSIADASAANPYLIKIMPGVYDLGTDCLRAKGYVDIEGSGKDVTKIKTSDSHVVATDPSLGPVNMEIRKIAFDIVIPTSGGNLASGPLGGGTLKFTEMTMTLASAGMPQSVTGVALWDGTLELNNVNLKMEVTALYSCVGIVAYPTTKLIINNSDLVMNNSTPTQGVWIPGGTATIKNSSINVNSGIGVYVEPEGGTMSPGSCSIYNSSIKAAAAYSLVASTSLANINAVGTQLDGLISGPSIKLINCYDGNFNTIQNQ